MNDLLRKNSGSAHFRKGMEMVQVAILIAIAIAAGLIFREKIESFIKNVFGGLNANSFKF